MEIQEIITREEVCERKVEEMGGGGKLRMNLERRREKNKIPSRRDAE